MPVGKESIKRASGARKKTTASKATAAKKTAAPAEAAAVTAESVLVPSPQVAEAVQKAEKNRTYGIKDELPIYLL